MNIRAIIGSNMSLDDGGGVESSSVVLTVNSTFRVLACAGMYLPCILCQEFLKGFNNKFDWNFDLLPTILNYSPMAHWEWDS